MRHNVARRNESLSLFEVGRVFRQGDATPVARGTVEHPGKMIEERRVAIALTGTARSAFWQGEGRDAKWDLFDLKGILEEFLEQFGIRGISFSRRAEPSTVFVESGAVTLGGKLLLGEFGQVSPILAKRYDLRDPVFVAELSLDQLLARRNPAKSFKALPQFPAIRRDIAMLVPETTTHEAVLSAAKQAKPANLEAVELFDVFRGKNIPAGQKSVAYSFTYRSAEKTLTDAEVNAAQEKVVEQFKRTLQATVRE